MLSTRRASAPIARAWDAKSTANGSPAMRLSRMKLLNEAPPLKFWRRLMIAKPPLSQTTTIILCPVRTEE